MPKRGENVFLRKQRKYDGYNNRFTGLQIYRLNVVRNPHLERRSGMTHHIHFCIHDIVLTVEPSLNPRTVAKRKMCRALYR